MSSRNVNKYGEKNEKWFGCNRNGEESSIEEKETERREAQTVAGTETETESTMETETERSGESETEQEWELYADDRIRC